MQRCGVMVRMADDTEWFYKSDGFFPCLQRLSVMGSNFQVIKAIYPGGFNRSQIKKKIKGNKEQQKKKETAAQSLKSTFWKQQRFKKCNHFEFKCRFSLWSVSVWKKKKMLVWLLQDQSLKERARSLRGEGIGRWKCLWQASPVRLSHVTPAKAPPSYHGFSVYCLPWQITASSRETQSEQETSLQTLSRPVSDSSDE